MELLLGAGHSVKKRITSDGKANWDNLVTLDINPDCNPDVIWDLNELPLPFEDNTFNEISAYHILEHFGGPQGNWQAFFNFFSEAWRILKPDGIFCGIVPDLNSRWLWTDPGHVRVISIETLTFLDQDEYKQQVGVTSLTDYRHWYKADFKIDFAETADDEFRFVLKAFKK